MKKHTKGKLKRNLPYIELLLVFFIPLLFVIAHLLHTISTQSEGMIWMGMNVDNLIVDITLYTAVFLSSVLLLLIFYQNRKSILKRKKRK